VVFLFILLHPPRSPLFPYTTLFRSRRQTQQSRRHRARYFPAHRGSPSRAHFPQTGRAQRAGAGVPPVPPSPPLHPFLTGGRPRRSEEHTSELQSRENLVCRLLLEKK